MVLALLVFGCGCGSQSVEDDGESIVREVARFRFDGVGIVALGAASDPDAVRVVGMRGALDQRTGRARYFVEVFDATGGEITRIARPFEAHAYLATVGPDGVEVTTSEPDSIGRGYNERLLYWRPGAISWTAEDLPSVDGPRVYGSSDCGDVVLARDGVWTRADGGPWGSRLSSPIAMRGTRNMGAVANGIVIAKGSGTDPAVRYTYWFLACEDAEDAPTLIFEPRERDESVIDFTLGWTGWAALCREGDDAVILIGDFEGPDVRARIVIPEHEDTYKELLGVVSDDRGQFAVLLEAGGWREGAVAEVWVIDAPGSSARRVWELPENVFEVSVANESRRLYFATADTRIWSLGF